MPFALPDPILGLLGGGSTPEPGRFLGRSVPGYNPAKAAEIIAKPCGVAAAAASLYPKISYCILFPTTTIY